MIPVLSAYVGDNSALFPNALSLYVKEGSDILDMTWGLGVFWKGVDLSKYKLVRNDIDITRGDVHYDFRNTEFSDGSFDVVILDPPYARSSGSPMKASVDRGYNNWSRVFEQGIVGNEAIMKFYADGAKEAYRLLRKKGVLFVKCMDEINSGKQYRNHIRIWKDALAMGFIDLDMFTLVQKSIPTMRHPYQLHSRKNNSFLWVFRKK
jgi:tRNA G10  N-methylase Trm11